MEIARRLIHEAAEGGADAIKFQTYRADTLASRDSPAYWDTSEEPTHSQFELFRRYDTFWKSEFEALKVECDSAGIEFMSTPFDTESADFLNDLMDVYKISSSDLTNLPFISLICRFGKPVLLSTGASYLWEIEEAVQVIRDGGNPFCLMHCILNYPTADFDANLAMIHDLRRRFPEALPGYSDHTRPNEEMDVLTVAALSGARVLEKHFTHDKTLPGNDHYHAMDMRDLKEFRRRNDRIVGLLGQPHKRPLPSEEPSRQNARRSLVARVTLSRGTLIAEDNLTWKRPASGISPREINRVVGRRAAIDIAEDAILQWSMLD
ncbi:MAG: N-acetylneuraminate synthase family protein [Chloroflexota bacterium]